jgi:hypothetical protein
MPRQHQVAQDLPEVPAMAEKGFPEIEGESGFALVTLASRLAIFAAPSQGA